MMIKNFTYVLTFLSSLISFQGNASNSGGSDRGITIDSEDNKN